jgi:hypothetical protein
MSASFLGNEFEAFFPAETELISAALALGAQAPLFACEREQRVCGERHFQSLFNA